jgi:branched-chain amino acid transport system substrate-binding protein
MRKQKIVGISAAVVAAALMLSACSSGGSAGPSPAAKLNTSNPVIIGLDADLTGPAAATAKPGLEGVQIATAKINAAGGVLGRELKIVQDGDNSDPTQISTVTRKLVSEGASSLMYITGSGAVLQVKTVLDQLKVPAIAATTQTLAVSAPPDNGYMFALANPATDQAPIWCDMWKKKGYTKLGILQDDSAAIAGTMTAVLPILDKCIKVVDDEVAPVTSTDLTAQAARLAAAKPDVLLVYSTGGSFEILAQNTLNSTLPKLLRFESGSIANSPDEWPSVNPGALSKVVYFSNFATDNKNTTALTAAVQKQDGADAGLSIYTAQAYDATYMLAKAVEKAGGTKNPTKIRNALQSIKNYVPSYGENGFTFSFSATKHLGADGTCSLIPSTFGQDNKPSGPWSGYKSKC